MLVVYFLVSVAICLSRSSSGSLTNWTAGSGLVPGVSACSVLSCTGRASQQHCVHGGNCRGQGVIGEDGDSLI